MLGIVGEYPTGDFAGLPTIGTYAGLFHGQVYINGQFRAIEQIQFDDLSGSGTRTVVANSDGILST